MKRILLITLSIISLNSLSIELKCIGDNILFNGNPRVADSEYYWENITVNKDILSIPKYGDFKRRSEGSMYWLKNDNWAKLDPSTGKFVLSMQQHGITKRQIQAKCSNVQLKLF